jgi:hypothetical protein
MRTALTLALLAMSGSAFAEVASGPKVGEKPAELKVYAVTGESKEKDVNYTEIRKDKPTVYVFIQADKWSRPMFRFVKTLDEKLGDAGQVVAIWLTDDADKSKEYLPKISTYFTNAALTVFTGEKAGPKDWGINIDAHVTAVVVNGGKVTKSFGYQSLNETDADAVVEVLKKK